MKVYVYDNLDALRMTKTKINNPNYFLLGTIDIHPEKKTVVKERSITTKDLACSLGFELGVNAKNLKLTYEYEVE